MLKETIYGEMDRLRSLFGTDSYDIEVEKLYQKYKDDTDARKEMSSYISEGIDAVGKRLEHLEATINMQTA